MTDEQFTEIVERLDRIEAALESLLGIAQASGGEAGFRRASGRPSPSRVSSVESGEAEEADVAELMKHQVRGWD